jgi:hypothetical protein
MTSPDAKERWLQQVDDYIQQCKAEQAGVDCAIAQIRGLLGH